MCTELYKRSNSETVVNYENYEMKCTEEGKQRTKKYKYINEIFKDVECSKYFDTKE